MTEPPGLTSPDSVSHISVQYVRRISIFHSMLGTCLNAPIFMPLSGEKPIQRLMIGLPLERPFVHRGLGAARFRP